MKKNKFLLISGGTGGHVIPAVNFGNYVIKKGHQCILIVDHRGNKYAKKFNGKIILINASHFSYNFFGKFKAVINFVYGFFQSFKYIITIKPNLCIAFGSYASFAPLSVLFFFKFFRLTNIYLHEQNSVMGRVNLLFSPFVNKIFLNFKDTLKLKEKYKKKSYFVGMPIENRLNYILRDTHINNNNIKKIFICGGSQGAVNLNKKLISLFLKMPQNIIDQIEFLIQCPDNQKNELKENFNKLKIKYEMKSFFDNFTEKLLQADILIGRAGAATISDIIFTQVPAIFVPLPSSTNQHQLYNAYYLSKKKAALIIKEEDLSNHKSFLIVTQFINDSNHRINLIKNLQKIKIIDSNQLIYNHLNE